MSWDKKKRGQEIHCKITYSKLAELFGVQESTIRRWRSQSRLDTTSLVDIVHKYNNRYLLDKRRSAPPPTPGQSIKEEL